MPTNKKLRRKNQISEYHVPSHEGYDEENMRSIDEKSPNPMRILRRKTKRSIKCDW